MDDFTFHILCKTLLQNPSKIAIETFEKKVNSLTHTQAHKLCDILNTTSQNTTEAQHALELQTLLWYKL